MVIFKHHVLDQDGQSLHQLVVGNSKIIKSKSDMEKFIIANGHHKYAN
jgi:hypothetical protein